MCLQSTLNKMLTISEILSQLSVAKMNIVGKIYADSKYPETSEDYSMEGMSSLDDECKKFTSQAIEAFVYILDFLLANSDSNQESNVVKENANSYLELLKNLVYDFPGYFKSTIETTILDKYKRVETKLIATQDETLLTQLLFCKMAMFD